MTPREDNGTDAAYLIELKHLTKTAGTEAALDRSLTEAREQAARYAESPAVGAIPRLKRVAAVFAGTRLARLTVDG